MPAAVQQTLAELERLAKIRGSVLVAYSGGKDSLAVLDLCAKTFPTVRAFFKYTVPGLEYCERQMRWAKDRYGIEPIQFPTISTVQALRDGLWCDSKGVWDDLPKQDVPLKVSFAYAMQATGCQLMATGMKDSDGLRRRQFFANIRDGKDPFWNSVVHPIKAWTKTDVLGYLKANKIAVPDCEAGAVTSGVGLDHGSLCWLHDRHHDDFKRLLRWFPYAGAAIKRREWFGVK